jgi:riboflavin synthase alpha subunit
MGYNYHKKHKHKLKNIEKKILYLIVPLTFILAFGIQIVIKGIPRWVYSIIVNMRMEETISRALIRGSAVRVETPLRKKYEEKFREDSMKKAKEDGKSWRDDYINILENTNKDEVKEYEKSFEAEKKKR